MAQISARHSKLWFAAQARNWALADYELEEIEESLADVSRFYPSHKNISGIPELIVTTMSAAITQTEQAIHAKDLTAVTAGYKAITVGCNVCHQAAGFAFNRIVQPERNVFTNQLFEVGGP